MRYGSSEEIEQISLFRWTEFAENRYPELRLLHHIPNGGKRTKSEAQRLKQAGVKSGVPDLELPVARGGYFGLHIEMKYDKNKTTENQRQWLADLTEQGRLAVVCYGWEQAKEVLEEYLKLPPTVVKGEKAQ